MNDLFARQLQRIYYAEQQLTKALPRMADKATDPRLKQGFLTHLEEIRQHVKRLAEVFKMHGAGACREQGESARGARALHIHHSVIVET